MRLSANFRYNIKPELSKDPFYDAQKSGAGQFSEISSGDYDKFDSMCKETMVGFIHQIPKVTGKYSTL